jgi:membrane protein implicated in regulation of membrane protease activity
MQNSKKAVGTAAGAAGAVAAACVACCVSLPLVAPLLAWLGISSFSFATFGWSLPLVGLAILALISFLAIRHRRNAALRCKRSIASCECDTSCKI